jgi:beta-glucosidase
MIACALVLLVSAPVFAQTSGNAPFQDPQRPVDQRVTDLIQRLTLKEKISLLGFVSPGVERLQIPSYVWWNEGLHGVARAGEATVFPQAIGAAATFDDRLLRREADAISTEARAKYNLSVAKGRRLQYMGLTFWSPNINIFRDPRWGRGQETYGEDPYLTGRMGVAFVKGIQGTNPDYLKAAACAKHFAVHSGPESIRHSINVQISEEDLRETYLPAFHTLVDSGVETVMCAYNRVNDQPCCTGKTLLTDILRDEWQFKGHVVTDCWALDDIWERHKVLPDRVSVAAAAIKAGVNLDCSDLLQADALQAVDKGLITETDIDKALIPNLRTAFRLGLYDDPGISPYLSYGADSVHNDYHQTIALQMARESIVLLKNDGVLPLHKDSLNTLLVTGSNASSADALLGNYHGVSPRLVTFTDGITAAAGPGIGVQYDMGCDPKDTVHFGGIWASQSSDAIVAVVGLTPLVEGEEGDAFLSDAGADKKTLSLPPGQIAFLRALRKASHHPIIVVVTGGSAMDIDAIAPYADAVLLAWYPGEQGGAALADVLFGAVSPSGHLPVTFYKNLSDLPAYEDYHMLGRTYRYFKGEVEYPFGFGLGYATFTYAWSAVWPTIHKPPTGWMAYPPNIQTLPPGFHTPLVSVKDTLYFDIDINNEGNMAADAVPQAYVYYPSVPGAGKQMPLKELKDFKRVSVPVSPGPDGSLGRTVAFAIPASSLRKWDPVHHAWRLYPGTYRVVIGENAADEKLSFPFIVK